MKCSKGPDLMTVASFTMNASRWLCVSLPSPRPRPRSQSQDCAQTQQQLLLSSHRNAHVGQSELSAEPAPVEGTHVLDSHKGGDGDGSADWEDWETVSEASINPFLLEEGWLTGLSRSTFTWTCLDCYLLLIVILCMKTIRICLRFGTFVKHFLH